MRSQLLATVFSVLAWALLAPTAWMSLGAQTIIFDVTDTVTAPHPENPRGAAYFAQKFSFNLTAGTTYVIRMRSTLVGPDPYIYLLSPTGALVGQDDDSDYNVQIWASKLTYTAPATGTYHLICTTYSAGQSFAYRAWVEELGPPQPPAGATPITVPADLTDSLTANTPHPLNPRGAAYNAKLYTIPLVAGQQYTFRITPTVAGDDSYIYILDPSGTLVALDDDGDMAVQIWATKLDYSPTVTGTFTIVATTYASYQAFGYRLRVDGPATPSGPPPTNPPTTPQPPTTGIPNVRLAPTLGETPTVVAALDVENLGEIVAVFRASLPDRVQPTLSNRCG